MLFVRDQPCLVCRQGPCDAHHLKFAQPRALGRKVSDEYTVPLCRAHHQDLHRHGNERAWWANLKIEPLRVAHDLWAASPIHGPLNAAVVNAAAPGAWDRRFPHHERAIPTAHELTATTPTLPAEFEVLHRPPAARR
ncbi:DUF968 domain-containing protein [Bradyrhizobium brasilense]|uniref:DUF968 domain-containing protein n=1 Tax=Bradyrhizobium brasilense TaxID=1419277 RepID=UPI003FCD0789